MRAALSGIHWTPPTPPVAPDSICPPKGVWSGAGLNLTPPSSPVSMATEEERKEEEEEGPASEEEGAGSPGGRGRDWEDEGSVGVELERMG